MDSFSPFNRRYLGNKQKLHDFIIDNITNNAGDFESFVDLFAGTGSVANMFSDKQLITNDLLVHNYLAHIAFFKASLPLREELVVSLLEEYNNLNVAQLEENYVSREFGDTYFSNNVAKKIGEIRERIEFDVLRLKLGVRERAYLITSLLFALDKTAHTVGHYDAFRKGGNFNEKLILRPLKIELGLNVNNECYNLDANELALTVEGDVIYLDPPYNSRQYATNYHVLENIADWKKPELNGKTRKMDLSDMRSEYSSVRGAEPAFAELIERLTSSKTRSVVPQLIVLSYNNATGEVSTKGGLLSFDFILNTFNRFGSTQVIEQDYKAFNAGKSVDFGNKELLFVCKVGQ